VVAILVTVKKIILRVARIKTLGSTVGVLFQYASAIFPVKRHGENECAICFEHPVPVSNFHLLAIPKRRIASLLDLTSPANDEALTSLFMVIEEALLLRGGRYRVSSNYGNRQDVMQVHFHIVEINDAKEKLISCLPVQWSRQVGGLCLTWSSAGRNGNLSVEIDGGDIGAAEGGVAGKSALKNALKLLVHQERAFLLSLHGFSLVIEISKHASSPLYWPNQFTITAEV
jgi:hypothetical protein